MGVFREGFLTGSGSGWPGWTSATSFSGPDDGRLVALRSGSSIGRVDLYVSPASGDGRTHLAEVIMTRDVSDVVDLTSSRWRTTWKLRLSRPTADSHLDLYVSVGPGSDVYSDVRLRDYVATGGGTGPEADLDLHSPDDDLSLDPALGLWDEDTFFYVELDHDTDKTESRFWRDGETRPDAPAMVVTSTTPPPSSVIAVGLQWSNADAVNGAGGAAFLEVDSVVAASGDDVGVVFTPGADMPIQLFVDHEDVSDDLEWSMSTEEVLGGVGRATLVIQDRSLTYQPNCHADVKAILRSTGLVLWRGEIISEPEDLPVGFPWRRWALDCADYNNELDWRLVGAFDGRTWRDIDNLGDYVNVDPFAQSLDTDKRTVQSLLDHYIRVDGEAFETTTYVYEYLTDFATLYWSYSKLQSSLEDLAAGVATNIQFWADPDLRFHWVSIPAWQDLAQESIATLVDATTSPLARGMPEAPTSDVTLSPARSIGDAGDVGCRELKFTLDGSSMPEQLYVRGSTGYVYNAPPIDPTVETTVTNPPVDTSLPPAAAYICHFLANTKVYYKDSSGLLSGVGSRGYVVVPSGSVVYTTKMLWVPWHQAGTPHPDAPTGRFWEILNGAFAGKYIDNDTNTFGYGKILMSTIPAPSTTPPPPGSPPPPAPVPSRCDDGAWASAVATGVATFSSAGGHSAVTTTAGAPGEVNLKTGLDATITDRVMSGHWRVSAKFAWSHDDVFAEDLVFAAYDETLADVYKVVLHLSDTTTTYEIFSPDPDVSYESGDTGMTLVAGRSYDVQIEGLLDEDMFRFKVFDDSLQEPAWIAAILYGAPTGTQWGLRVDVDKTAGVSATTSLEFSSLCFEDRPTTFSSANVGIGGSGFVKDVIQDPNKRQAYLEAPVSADRSTRDALGGQVLYRGSRPTLRGSCKVTGGVAADGTYFGPEGYRVGQLIPIFDSRLPDFLNGRYFMIQRVQATLIPTHDLREYILDWGDGPTSRWTMQAKTSRGIGVGLPPPAIQMVVQPFDLSPSPNASQVVTAQMVNGSGQPWAVSGKMVEWTLEAYDASGVLVHEGSIDPTVSMTDANGAARTTLTTGPTVNRVYYVFAEVPVS